MVSLDAFNVVKISMIWAVLARFSTGAGLAKATLPSARERTKDEARRVNNMAGD